MDKVIFIITPILSIIPWLFPSIEWYWRLLVTLCVLIATCIAYCFVLQSKMKRLEANLEDKAMEIIEVNDRYEGLKKSFEQEENSRISLARMYGSCERDSEKFIVDIRGARQDLYQIYTLLNQNKTRKDSNLIKEFGRTISSIEKIIERENKHGRERNISNNKNH